MRIASFDFRPSLLPTLAFAALFALLSGLGLWQLDRAAQKQQALKERSNRASDVLVDLNDTWVLGAEARYRPVVARGTYRDMHWLLDNRVRQGQAGYHVFTLFELEGPGARAVLVNRGWVPTGETREFLPNVTAPTGRVELRGRLDRPAAVGLELASADLAGLAAVKRVQYLDIAELAAALQRELVPLAVVLDEGQPGVFTRDWVEKPGMTPEKHLGYAVQWFALAVALLIIYFGVNTRRAHVTDDDRPIRE
jgi:surfeit locus 1 family protein